MRSFVHVDPDPRTGLPETLRECLDATLAYAAARVPYYRDRLGPVSAGRTPALADFPLIDRAVVADEFSRFVVADRFPDYLVASGGTTGGMPAVSLRSDQEYEVAHHFLTGFAKEEAPALEDIDQFVLDVFLNTNGYARRKAPGWPVVSVALERRSHAELIRRLIADGLDLGTTVIPAGRVQSQNGPLRTLTGYFTVTGFEPANAALDSVAGYGSHISRVWRARLEQFWGASVVTMYGLTEFGIGNAVECGECGSYHYLTAWPEFLLPSEKSIGERGLSDQSTVEHGDAQLVLTSLVPFVVVQPRIRYVTGDVVTVTGRCPRSGLPGFRFRGRMASCLWDERNAAREALLSETDVLEVVDQLPDVNTRRHTADIQLWEGGDLPRPPFRMGFPRLTLPGGWLATDRQVRLSVEVTFDPEREPARARALRERLIRGMYEEVPRLQDLVDAGEAQFCVCLAAPGGLPV